MFACKNILFWINKKIPVFCDNIFYYDKQTIYDIDCPNCKIHYPATRIKNVKVK